MRLWSHKLNIIWIWEHVTTIPWSDPLGDVEVDESLVTEAALDDAMVEVVDASLAAVVVISWSDVLWDAGVCNLLVTEVALVDEMVEAVDALKSVTSDATLVWEVVNNVVSREMQILISSYKYWSSYL